MTFIEASSVRCSIPGTLSRILLTRRIYSYSGLNLDQLRAMSHIRLDLLVWTLRYLPSPQHVLSLWKYVLKICSV